MWVRLTTIWGLVHNKAAQTMEDCGVGDGIKFNVLSLEEVAHSQSLQPECLHIFASTTLYNQAHHRHWRCARSWPRRPAESRKLPSHGSSTATARLVAQGQQSLRGSQRGRSCKNKDRVVHLTPSRGHCTTFSSTIPPLQVALSFACSVASLSHSPSFQLPGWHGLRHGSLADYLLGWGRTSTCTAGHTELQCTSKSKHPYGLQEFPPHNGHVLARKTG